MASDFKINVAMRNAMCDAAVDLLDTGTGAATIAVRTGAPPADIDDASTGTLLGTLTHNATAFGNAGASNPGEAIAATITSDTNADASGEAGHFRTYRGAAGDTEASWEGTAGDAGDTPDLEFDNDTIVAGGTIAISSMTFTVPEQC